MVFVGEHQFCMKVLENEKTTKIFVVAGSAASASRRDAVAEETVADLIASPALSSADR